MSNIIEVRNVTKQFVNHKALDNVSLSVKEGIVFGLLGPNGAGKTTLIRILNRITMPDAGEILFKGRPMQDEDVREIGYLPEERGLYKKMKVGEQAVYLARLKGLSKEVAEQRLRAKFKQFNILEWWSRSVEELSKGMQQKLQFITTIIHKPSFVILDEPFSGFDPINANLLKSEILQLKKEGTSIILSTHNMASVEEICDEIALIHQSRKVLEGNIFDIKNQFKKNIFYLEMNGSQETVDREMANRFEILERLTLSHTFGFRVRIPAEMSANDLLQCAMMHGTVSAFQEVLPTMNEVFIETVESINQQ